MAQAIPNIRDGTFSHEGCGRRHGLARRLVLLWLYLRQGDGGDKQLTKGGGIHAALVTQVARVFQSLSVWEMLVARNDPPANKQSPARPKSLPGFIAPPGLEPGLS